MKKKLNLQQKVSLYKMRNLSWHNRQDINKPLTEEELEELEKLGKKELEESELNDDYSIPSIEPYETFETCMQCKTKIPKAECLYTTFTEYLKEEYENADEKYRVIGTPLINYARGFGQEATYWFEFCSEDCIKRFKEENSKGDMIVI